MVRRSYDFDQLFIGADGIDLQRGTTTFNELLGLSRVMAEVARWECQLRSNLGLLIHFRVLAHVAKKRQEAAAVEVSTFIPLLRILFESGMAVEQALRVLSIEARQLLPVLTGELRLVLARVDSGLELSQELDKAASLLAVDEFDDTCVILKQLLQQGGGAFIALPA